MHLPFTLMARPIDPQLRTLQHLLYRMADLVDEQLADAADALLRHDTGLAERVHRRDDEVDALELEIDHEAVRVLALHQPLAIDFRTVIAAVKMNNDLERIGDHAKNLAKYTPHLSCADAVACTQFGEIVDDARAMLRGVQDAFERRDRLAARQILARDLQLDRFIDSAFENVVDYGREHPADLPAVAYLILVLKGLERIGDHVKNIARSIVFLVEGEDIRHPRASYTSESSEESSPTE